MTGKITREKYITRQTIQANHSTTFYVFGDNMVRRGFGGQAKEMRGEPNTIGIPTKWKPNTTSTSYLSNSDWNHIGVEFAIKSALFTIERLLKSGFNVVIPQDGIGTGMAKLHLTAPKIFKIIQDELERLEGIYK